MYLKKITVELADDLGDRDLVRRSGKLVPALGAALAGDQAAAAELGEDALEELRRDVLGRGELLGRRQAGWRRRELRHRPERVVDLGRDPHRPILLAAGMRAVVDAAQVARVDVAVDLRGRE